MTDTGDVVPADPNGSAPIEAARGRDKDALRALYRARRASAHKQRATQAADAVAARFVEVVAPRPGMVVAGYHAVGNELDVMALLHRLHETGVRCALPVVGARGEAMVFRRWRPGAVLKPGAFRIPEPTSDAEELIPDVVVVPFVAVDPCGQRLGQGAGFYDVTLEALRAREVAVQAVGVGYDEQLVDRVPHEAHDQPLDMVITDRRTVKS